MNKIQKLNAAVLAATIAASTAASAAVPAGVTDAITAAGADALVVGGAVLVAVVALLGIRLMRKEVSH